MWKQLTKNLRRLSALLLLLATVVNIAGCVDLPKITTENTIDTGGNLQKLVDSNYAHLEKLSESIGGDARTTITSFMTQLEIYSLQLDKIAARRIADLDARTQAKMLEIQRYTEAVNQYAQEITHIIGDETEQLVKVTGEETRITVDKISGEAQILIGATGQEVRLTIDKASGELQVLSGMIGEELRLTIEKIAQEAAKLLDKATQDVREILREIEISQRRLERDVEQGLVRVINGILYGVVIAFDLGLAVGGVLSGLILTFIAAYGWGRLIFRYKLPMAGIQRAIAIGLLFVTFIVSVSPFVFLSGQIRERVLISPIVNGAAPIVSSGNNLPPFIDTPEIWLFKPESIIISSTSRTLEAIGANLTAWGEPQIAYANIPLSVLGITEDKITINIEPVLHNPSFADYIGIQFHNRTANVDYRVPIVIATPTPPLTPIPSPTATLEPTPEVVVNTNMNVRSGPGTAYPIIGAAAVGQKFYVKGKNSSGEWWKIDYNGQEGWLFGQLVTPERTADVAIEQNIPTPPPPTPIPPTPIPLATICPQPVVTGFTVTSTNIRPGEETILRWNRVENVQSVAIADGDTLIGVDFSGELKVSPKQPTTTYKLTVGYCDNKTMVLDEVTVYVTEATLMPIPALPSPSANFDASPRSGIAPFTVQFSDLSTGNPTEWIWQFGDGGTSRVQNPSYTYNRPGLYEVQLTVVNEQGSDSKMLDTAILVEAPPPPPTPVIRHWRIAGVMRIWDDENFGGDERGEHSFSDNRTLMASQPIQAYDIRRCTGKEVVGEIHLQLRLEDQGAIRVVGSLLYFEEDTCNADDLEKRQNIEYLLQPGQSEHVRIKLGDGDGSVDFDFTMTNTGD